MSDEPVTLAFYILYGFAYGVSVIAFLMTNILILRLLVILSSTGFAVYYYGFPADPLWLDVIAELAFVAVNIFMMAYLIWSNWRIKFDQREEFLYQNEFSALTRMEFRKMLKIGNWHLTDSDEVLTTEGKPLEHIYYLVSGRAIARMADGSTKLVSQGSVIGEISYRLKSQATATVTATERCISLRWNQAELRQLCEKIENIQRAVDNVMSSHMARKLSSGIDQQDPVGELD
jgi:hypothetical protein